ncbi:phytanoyl-CoA dioxygenase family protein [Ferrovibrio terrae]|uniref:phytanoyl-CoA dioxygenase family protein n=1 Tax=Ferrovibrio terrae TaxID=2594003 RepID=UPI0031379986
MLETKTRSFVHHMRGMFDVATLRQVREHFDAVEHDRQAQVKNDTERQRLRIGASTDAFRADPVWYDVWRNASPILIERMRPFTWLLYPVMIRHITEQAHLVPWHQDIGYVRRMARVHRQLVTCFVPLEYKPAEASSLEFAVGDFPEFEHVTMEDHGAGINREFKDTVSFSLDFGDALVFGDHTPHRTTRGPDGSVQRRSFEYRGIMPADALPGKDYFDIESGEMVHVPLEQRREA